MGLSLVVCVGWIFALCIHEFCHAAVAYAGGDKSVKDKGYLTLNPIKYTDPGLTLVIPIIMLMLGGIALPGAAVYIDRSKLRNKFWHSAVSAAGPFGSAVMIFVYASPFMLGFVKQNSDYGLWPALALLVLLQIVCLILNSLPIPPLDGYGVIEPWLPRGAQEAMNRFGQFGIWIVFGLLWFVEPLNAALWITAMLIAHLLSVPGAMIQTGYQLFSEQKYYLIGVLFIIMMLSKKGKKSPPQIAAKD
jgi:Zn-dependent protease